MDVIKRDTSIKEAEAMLKAHRCPHRHGWEIAIGLMLQQCDYLELHDYGDDAYFVKKGISKELEAQKRKWGS